MEFVVNTVKCKNTAVFISQIWQELLAFQLLKWLFTPEMIQDNKLRHSRLSARLLTKNYSMKLKQTEQKARRLANALEQTLETQITQLKIVRFFFSKPPC